MMLDEIDKLGRGIQGDPSSAMLEVLDPEQNNTFRDNYLGVPFDLSRVVFIATANMLDTIPGPLRDRMEVISLAGYTEDEKLEIARRYLVRRQLEANGLTADQVEITDEALRAIIRAYTREAGVRNLEREIGSVLRHAAVRDRRGQRRAGPDRRGRSRGDPRRAALRERGGDAHQRCRASRPGSPGRRSAATSCSSRRRRMPGKGGLILTGQLGEVMRESAQAALTLVKSRAAALGIDPALFEKSDIHIHVPAGAIPKDGPSAGVAMFIALALAADRPDGAQRHRDDRRDHAARPRAAGRRHQGEGGRGRRAPG